MLNKYPLWKYLILIAALLVACFFALPNLFGSDPSVQVSARRGHEVTVATQEAIRDAFKKNDLAYRSISLQNGSLMIRMDNEDAQLKAAQVVESTLGKEDYVAALSLESRTPAWLETFNAKPMYLGLDLRGGVHFLMEVDMDTAIAKKEDSLISDFRRLLREENVRYSRMSRQSQGGIEIQLKDAATAEQAKTVISKDGNYSDLLLTVEQRGADAFLTVRMPETVIKEVRELALKQNITTLRNRVNELGVSEPIIQQQGFDRVVVQLPGVQDPTTAKKILGTTATLEFRMVDEEHDVQEALNGKIPAGSRLYRKREGGSALLKNRVMLTGEYIIDAKSGIDTQTGGPAVFITLDGKGASIFAKATDENLKKLMAVVFIEQQIDYQTDKDGKVTKTKHKTEEIINIARIQDRLSKRFQITGLDSTDEANNLALLLRAGALAAPISIIEERTIGPSLGKENIQQGFNSTIIGFVVVLAFMFFWYKGFGLVANVALAFNLVMIIAILSMFQATLTLPGIAGIVLTVGMAVDANVLIFERIREELRLGSTPQASIHAGYSKALSTIADANITTFIAGVILFGFGSGPIRGFAVTLCIGILTSMFSAIMGTRGIVNLIYGGRKVEKLSI